MKVIQQTDGTYQHGVTLIFDESTPNCTVEMGHARYSQAAQVLDAIGGRLLKCKPPPMKLPELNDICRGNSTAVKASRVPEDYRCSFLLENINTIAGVLQWTVHPDLNKLHPAPNAAIWFYNSDIGHSFSHRILNIRYNVIIMIFLWALDQAGEGEGSHPWCKYINPPDEQGRARYDFWTSFIQAWLASLRPDGDFSMQLSFLELWKHSEFDLVLFSRNKKRQMDRAIKKLTSCMPKVPFGDPLKFLEMAKSGNDMQLDEIRQAGPAYALHFVMASGKDADEFDRKMDEMATNAEEEQFQMKELALMNARMDRDVRLADFGMAALHIQSAEDQGMDVDDDGEEDDFRDVHFSNEEDEMGRGRHGRRWICLA